MGFTTEFLNLLDYAKDMARKQTEAKRLLESQEAEEHERHQAKLRAEEEAKQGVLEFFESWKPSSEPMNIKRRSQNDPIIKTVINGVERIVDE